MKPFVLFCILMNFLLSPTCIGQPWINSSDLMLRADIETLADIGVITVPITTYPLMWSGVIKNIDNTDISAIPSEYKSVFWRVKNASKKAFANKSTRQVNLTLSNSEKVFRSFGDQQRGKSELRASSSQVGKNIAWNIEVSRLLDPIDGESTIYEGSHVSLIWGNWIASVGEIEKWWGASWDSANLLSNNAKAPLALSLSRNYSVSSENTLLSWIGNWNVSAFISQLESDRFIVKPIFSGLTFSAKPFDALEASFRLTQISGGNVSFNLPNKKDKTITGLDLRWTLPFSLKWSVPTSIYAGVTDEGYSDNSSRLLGITSLMNLYSTHWRTYLEYSDTTSENQYQLTYADNYYQSGYRHQQRAIGSTYDGQSQALTLGMIGNIDRYQNIELKLQSLNINELIENKFVGTRNTISNKPIKLNRIMIKWHLKADKNNSFDVEFEANDKV
ncbi:MAG: capsule assembly Wzi family protein, partial [Kangiellaceae bacterium]